MSPKEFVAKRLMDMATKPEMWAASNEGFGLQLALLVEVYQLDLEPWSKTMPHEVMSRLFGPGPAVRPGPLSADWAQYAALAVRKMLGLHDIGQLSQDL